MKQKNTKLYSLLITLISLSGMGTTFAGQPATANTMEFERARWHPSHFRPAIDNATNEQCLSCHQEIMEHKVLDQSPAGVKASESLAWYQTLHTYEGPQMSFHQRHLIGPQAKQLMNMKCNTCHQGHDPREEAPIPPDQGNQDFTLRKSVNPNTCLMCHGIHPFELMGLPGPWPETRDTFQNNCNLCHAGIRTNRHQVNFLKAEAIEEAAKEDGDVCYGCHGGRAWYRIAYPYPRHTWDGAAKEVPEWAKERPTESNPRFLIRQKQAQK